MKPLLRRSLLHEGRQWAVLDRKRSAHGILLVIQRKDGSGVVRRRLLNDDLIQNTYDPEQKKSLSTFTGALTGLASAYAVQMESVLCIGVGAGMVPRQLATHGAAVDAVEINPDITKLAEQHFDFDPTAVNLIIDEGRSFAEQSPDTYDVVVLDAFLGMSVPPHLLTLEAMGVLRDRLSSSGVLVINTFGEFDAKRREMSACLDCTLREVFGEQSVGAHASGQGNVFHVATHGQRLEPVCGPDFTGEHPAIQFELQLMWKGRREFKPGYGRVLTDAMLPSPGFTD